jgi:hypothetical protein
MKEMDSSMLTALRRNRTIATSSGVRRFESGEAVVDSKAGKINVVFNGNPILSDPKPPIEVLPEPDVGNLHDTVILAIESVLRYASTKNLGPTVTSRLLYLSFMSFVGSWNWISPSGPITGIKDTWNWDTHNILTDALHKRVWMTHTIGYAVLSANNNDVTVTQRLLQIERDENHWDEEQQAQIWNEVSHLGNFPAWESTWLYWFYRYRNNDGNNEALAIPDPGQLPNSTNTFVVHTTRVPNDLPYIQNINDLPRPTQWLPLKINGVIKNYYTYNWNAVVSSCLTVEDEARLVGIADTYYPSYGKEKPTDACDSVLNKSLSKSPRQTEIIELVKMSGTLTDTQKILAEFWANGPFTISPPGAMVWFWKSFIKHFMHTGSITNDEFLYSGLDLAIQLFEAGRIVWGIKKKYMQARPIQEIRRMFFNCEFSSWNGQVYGATWQPYQMPNFVTPPFADFVSGHSTYSQVFANVMAHWFGPIVPKTSEPIEEIDLHSFCPMFSNTPQTMRFAEFLIPKGASTIQPNIVPKTDVLLSWTTWQSLANTAGLSRQYGGIHCMSAHLGGQAVGNALSQRLRSRWFS